MVSKVLLSNDGKRFFVSDSSKDYHCQFGFIKASDLKKKAGSYVKTNKGEELLLIDPFFSDTYSKIKRGPQIIPLKDIGAIITLTGINKKSLVVESGTGSGATACLLASIAKKVVSYEIREDFSKVALHNKQLLSLSNLTLKNKDVTKGIAEKNVDVILFDLPAPWDAVDTAYKALKPGGYLVSYSPTIPQVSDFISKAKQNFSIMKVCEILERDWEVDDRKVRPKSQAIGHSGFLVIARKTK